MALPLFVVVLVQMIKDAYEDYKRAQSDKKENNMKTTLVCVNEKGEEDAKEYAWENLKVGQLIKVEQG